MCDYWSNTCIPIRYCKHYQSLKVPFVSRSSLELTDDCILVEHVSCT